MAEEEVTRERLENDFYDNLNEYIKRILEEIILEKKKANNPFLEEQASALLYVDLVSNSKELFETRLVRVATYKVILEMEEFLKKQDYPDEEFLEKYHRIGEKSLALTKKVIELENALEIDLKKGDAYFDKKGGKK